MTCRTFAIFENMKAISCGVIIIDKATGQLLACHPSCHPWRPGNYDIPKGHVEAGETHIDTALRELKEEANITLKKEDLFDCGLFLYTKYKDLHLYVAETAVDLQKLSCSTYFSFEGRMPLEVDGYKLVAPDNYGIYFRSLGPLVKICMERYREHKNNAAGRQV